MSMLEELFGLDEAEEAEALERVIEGGSDDEEPAGHADDEAEEERRVVDPTKPKKVTRVTKNPRLLLNAARLTGPRGIQTVTEHFKDFKFKGKGHEKEDLDMVLKRLEHWAHRLYPKFEFADCLKKIETLGNKKPVQVTLRKIRSDQIITPEIITQRDSSDDEQPPVETDEFDILLQQQIELASATPLRTPGSAIRTAALTAPKATSSPSISEEQKMRMLRNKQLAEERRRKKDTSEQVVDLTGINQPVTTSTTHHIDLTALNNPLSSTTSCTDLTESTETLVESGVIDNTVSSGVQKENIAPNVMETDYIDIDNNEYDMVSSKADSNEVRKSIKKRLAIIESSDEEMEEQINGKIDRNVSLNEKDQDINYSSNVSTEQTPIHYSDSSDEESAVNTVQVSVTADVHKTLATQNSAESIVGRFSENNDADENDEACHYSGSSDEECAVTNTNISVTADVHNALASQNSENIVAGLTENNDIHVKFDEINNKTVNLNTQIKETHNANEKTDDIHSEMMEIDTTEKSSKLPFDKNDPKETTNDVYFEDNDDEWNSTVDM